MNKNREMKGKEVKELFKDQKLEYATLKKGQVYINCKFYFCVNKGATLKGKKTTWEGGVWKNGDWLNGVWKNGVWKDGVWKNGTWIDGFWEGGVWEKGTWYDGIWQKSTWEKGIWRDKKNLRPDFRGFLERG